MQALRRDTGRRGEEEIEKSNLVALPVVTATLGSRLSVIAFPL